MHVRTLCQPVALYVLKRLKRGFSKIILVSKLDLTGVSHGGRASPRNGIFANVDVYPDLPQKF